MKTSGTLVTRLAMTIAFVAALHVSAVAQIEGIAENLNLPTASPGAIVTQEIGLSQITVSYHRPQVKDRKIWGTQLAPYNGKPFPWRAGANENTTFTITHDAKIDGKDLVAGSYGVHMIPTPEDWTIIFSNTSTSWGSFFYDDSEDALRITVTPEKARHQEALSYSFDDITSTSTRLSMRWEKLRVSFKIEFDVNEIVLESIGNQLRSVPAFSWIGWYQAAGYSLDNDFHLEEGLAWIEQSVRRQENYSNLRRKARLLIALDRADEARPILEKALENAPKTKKKAIEEILAAL